MPGLITKPDHTQRSACAPLSWCRSVPPRTHGATGRAQHAILPLPTSNMPHEQVEHTVRIFITVSSISIVITVGPIAPRAVLITRATTSARASA